MPGHNKKEKQALEDVLKLLKDEFKLPSDIFLKPPSNNTPLNFDDDDPIDSTPDLDPIDDDPVMPTFECFDNQNNADGTNRDCMGAISVGGEPEIYCSGNTCRECVRDRHCPENFICAHFTCLRQTEPDDDDNAISPNLVTFANPTLNDLVGATYPVPPIDYGDWEGINVDHSYLTFENWPDNIIADGIDGETNVISSTQMFCHVLGFNSVHSWTSSTEATFSSNYANFPLYDGEDWLGGGLGAIEVYPDWESLGYTFYLTWTRLPDENNRILTSIVCSTDSDFTPDPDIELSCSDPLALNFDDGTYSGNWSCPTNPTTCQAWLDETLPINNYTGDWLNDNCCCYNLDGISLDYLPGDMNNDGILNVSDIVIAIQIILGLSPYPDIFDIYIPPSSPESDGETTWYLNELQQIANILSTEFEDTIEVNPQLSDNLQIYIDNVNVELNETINYYVSEIQTLQFLIGDLESQNTSLQNTISDYESYFADIIAQINLYFPEDDLSDVDYSLYSLTIGGYFTTFQTEITDLNTQIADLNNTIASNESTINEYISQIQTLQLLVGDLEAQVSELQGQVDSIPGLESTITNLTDLVNENLTDYTLLTTYLGLPYTLTDNNIQADYNLNDGSVTCTSYLDPEVDDGATRCLPSTADDNLVEEPDWPTIYISPNTWSGVAMLLPPDIEYPVSILDNSWFEDPEGTIPLTWCDGTTVQTITMFSPDNQYINAPTYLSFIGGWLGSDLRAGIYYSITTPATNTAGPEGCSVSGYFKFTNNS